MSKTPRTDAALLRTMPDQSFILDLRPYGQVVPADFARTLERELYWHEAKELNEFKANLTAELGLVRRERDSFQRMLHVQEENSRRLERELEALRADLVWAKQKLEPK